MGHPSRSICKIFVFISWSVAPESHELCDCFSGTCRSGSTLNAYAASEGC